MTRRRKVALSAATLITLAIATVVLWILPASTWVRLSSSVTICELDPTLPTVEASAAAFPIRPYNTWTPIRSSRQLSGSEAARIVRAFLDAANNDGGQALCHEPAYGLIFHLGPIETFRTSVCFECNNYYDRIRSEFRWRGFSDRAPELLDALATALPTSAVSPR